MTQNYTERPQIGPEPTSGPVCRTQLRREGRAPFPAARAGHADAAGELPVPYECRHTASNRSQSGVCLKCDVLFELLRTRVPRPGTSLPPVTALTLRVAVARQWTPQHKCHKPRETKWTISSMNHASASHASLALALSPNCRVGSLRVRLRPSRPRSTVKGKRKTVVHRKCDSLLRSAPENQRSSIRLTCSNNRQILRGTGGQRTCCPQHHTRPG